MLRLDLGLGMEAIELLQVETAGGVLARQGRSPQIGRLRCIVTFSADLAVGFERADRLPPTPLAGAAAVRPFAGNLFPPALPPVPGRRPPQLRGVALRAVVHVTRPWSR